LRADLAAWSLRQIVTEM